MCGVNGSWRRNNMSNEKYNNNSNNNNVSHENVIMAMANIKLAT